MENDIRMMIANEIDRLQSEIEKESNFPKRMCLRAKSKVLFAALTELNDIQDKIINI